MSAVPALDALVGELEAAFAAGAPGQRVAAMLGLYAEEHRDWREFALFEDAGYTRNQVARTDRFDLLILCWGPGQASPIHNHEGQDCWMAVLDGEVSETHFPEPEGPAPGPLVPLTTRTFTQGQVAYISDEIALHLVRGARPDRPAVSLHLYADPYDACNCYCPETGRVTRKQLSNHSVRGRILAGESRG